LPVQFSMHSEYLIFFYLRKQNISCHKEYYLHATKPPWQPRALLNVPTHMSMPFSHSNSSGTRPPFSPQTSVPCALKIKSQT
jgi:hypothetical protein